MKRFIISVEGMRCGMCEAHVNDAARKSGASKVKASHKKNEVDVVCENVEPIIEAIKKDGYNVNGYEEVPEKKGLFK